MVKLAMGVLVKLNLKVAPENIRLVPVIVVHAGFAVDPRTVGEDRIAGGSEKAEPVPCRQRKAQGASPRASRRRSAGPAFGTR